MWDSWATLDKTLRNSICNCFIFGSCEFKLALASVCHNCHLLLFTRGCCKRDPSDRPLFKRRLYRHRAVRMWGRGQRGGEGRGRSSCVTHTKVIESLPLSSIQLPAVINALTLAVLWVIYNVRAAAIVKTQRRPHNCRDFNLMKGGEGSRGHPTAKDEKDAFIYFYFIFTVEFKPWHMTFWPWEGPYYCPMTALYFSSRTRVAPRICGHKIFSRNQRV